MQGILTRIKRAVLAGRYQFTEKAQIEMDRDRITEQDVVESIMNAYTIYKSLRSRSRRQFSASETLYVIQSPNFDGLAIYTKGKLVKKDGRDHYYFLISAKRAW